MDVKECTERLQTELKESSEGIAQRMEEGVECLEREIRGVHGRTAERIDEGVGRLERKIQDVQRSVSQLREQIIRRVGPSSAELGE
ncbi:hypothetical protein OS493_021114 [Desmophyllum pertusum]|uniref:Uncharacterized protein n=1 Tax=Desmophyllum pertusum TaxID=174260 RepID=A0A9W9ZN79_9CNID|nr:hypothetical protein OS493_021114 [Desmophyllum pertusum]